MKKTCFILLSFIFLISGYSYALNSIDVLGYVPPPKLIEPTGEKVDLSGKDNLTFSWGKHIGMNALGKYFDFRLYKGTDIVESNLIFKERVPGNEYETSVPSNLFVDKGVYTWSLKLCYRTSSKSRRSIKTFQVEMK